MNNNKKIENEKNYLSYLSRKSQQLVSLNIDLDHWNSTRTGVGLDPSSVVSDRVDNNDSTGAKVDALALGAAAGGEASVAISLLVLL